MSMDEMVDSIKSTIENERFPDIEEEIIGEKDIQNQDNKISDLEISLISLDETPRQDLYNHNISYIDVDNSDISILLDDQSNIKKKLSKILNSSLNITKINNKRVIAMEGKAEEKAKTHEILQALISPHLLSPSSPLLQKDLLLLPLPSDPSLPSILQKIEEEHEVILSLFPHPSSLSPLPPLPSLSLSSLPSPSLLLLLGKSRPLWAALLQTVALIDKKVPHFFTKDCEGESLSPLPDYAIDRLPLPSEAYAYAVGKEGMTRRKLSLASECLIEYVEGFALFCGRIEEREKGREYYLMLLRGREGEIRVEGVEERRDVSVVFVRREDLPLISGPRLVELRRVEDKTGTFIFLNGPEKKEGEGEGEERGEREERKGERKREITSYKRTPTDESLLIFSVNEKNRSDARKDILNYLKNNRFNKSVKKGEKERWRGEREKEREKERKGEKGREKGRERGRKREKEEFYPYKRQFSRSRSRDRGYISDLRHPLPRDTEDLRHDLYNRPKSSLISPISPPYLSSKPEMEEDLRSSLSYPHKHSSRPSPYLPYSSFKAPPPSRTAPVDLRGPDLRARPLDADLRGGNDFRPPSTDLRGYGSNDYRPVPDLPKDPHRPPYADRYPPHRHQDYPNDTPNDFRASPNDYRASPNDYRAATNDYRGVTTNDYRGSPNGGPTSDYRGAPNDYRGAPSDYRGAPNDFRGAPSDYRGSSSEYKGSGNGYKSVGSNVATSVPSGVMSNEYMGNGNGYDSRENSSHYIRDTNRYIKDNTNAPISIYNRNAPSSYPEGSPSYNAPYTSVPTNTYNSSTTNTYSGTGNTYSGTTNTYGGSNTYGGDSNTYGGGSAQGGTNGPYASNNSGGYNGYSGYNTSGGYNNNGGDSRGVVEETSAYNRYDSNRYGRTQSHEYNGPSTNATSNATNGSTNAVRNSYYDSYYAGGGGGGDVGGGGGRGEGRDMYGYRGEMERFEGGNRSTEGQGFVGGSFPSGEAAYGNGKGVGGGESGYSGGYSGYGMRGKEGGGYGPVEGGRYGGKVGGADGGYGMYEKGKGGRGFY